MSDSPRNNHPVVPSQLSAYSDKALTPLQARAVEAHLAGCPICRQRLADYSLLGRAMRSEEPLTAPVSLDRRVAALLEERTRAGSPFRASPRSGWWDLSSLVKATVSGQGRFVEIWGPRLWPGRLGLAATLLFLVVLGAVLFDFPIPGRGGPAVVTAYACDDPTVCAVAVQFSGPIDRSGVEQSLRLDPPVPVTTTWQGDTLLIKPAQPLQTAANYTLSVQPQTPDSKATPVALQFVTRGPSSPVAMATRGVGIAAVPPTSTATPAPPATSTPVPAAIVPTASATATPSPCAVLPARGFGKLYQEQPQVAGRLGCALGPERGVEMAIQPFQGGALLWRSDPKAIIALLEGGKWQSYRDTFDGTEPTPAGAGEPIRGFGKVWRENPELRSKLGASTAPERAIHTVVEEFERGLLIWTEDRSIHVLYADGSWEMHPDTFVDATPMPTGEPGKTPGQTSTASPTATSSPTPTVAGPTLTPTPSSSPTPAVPAASTPTTTGCAPPVRGFGQIYSNNPAVAARLGCAHSAERGVPVARQGFEHGLLIWRSDNQEIIAIGENGTWAAYKDTWTGGEPLDDVGTVPAGMVAPQGGFGKLWRKQPGLRSAFGWATAQEAPLPGAVQGFAGGQMLWTGDRVIYVLYPDGTWRSFVDTFVE